MKVIIEEGCIGCGQCEACCPEVFRMNDNNEAEVYSDITPELETTALEAASACPVSIIIIN